MAYAYRQNRNTLGGLGYADAEAIEANAVNAGIEAGKNAVLDMSGSSGLTESGVFYYGFVDGYNQYMQSINSKIRIDITGAMGKVTYKKTQTTPNEVVDKEFYDYGPGSAQYGNSGLDTDTGLKYGDPGYDFQGQLDDMSSSDSDSGEAVITVKATGETITIKTKKAGISFPVMIALGAGAVLLILLLKDKK